MNDLLGNIKWIGQALQPFLPETAEKIAKAIRKRKTEPLFKRLK